ncbi:DUF4276 family protein [Anabaena cylindrica UHCC 0172]|uniref:DUF4276 family protein n=1 Tax=Anabaena cylindrica TaxID=1165 RepID=UPI002B21824F|nr:DUF4276 family protein [Anabaena cylindrica]MEA5553599.1 DUF4276 family protein [Anabaena cylindrica UHCC 0172]
MVVWVFAGGGESEVAGLIPFLEKNFPGCRFKRYTPIRQKLGPKPGKVVSYGSTGNSLIVQITKQLSIALQNKQNKCDLILVLDDLDCRDTDTEKYKNMDREKILDAIREQYLAAISKIPECDNINKLISFAAPELESWIIADWSNTIAKHPDFRSRHERMRWWLSTKRKIPFDNPESFSEYDKNKNSCREKLSDALIDSTKFEEDINNELQPFSKKSHTPDLLREIRPDEVQRKCPLFRELYNYLHNFCSSSPGYK